MEDGAIIPDGEVVLAPAEAHLQIVVLGDELGEIVLEDLALSLRDPVDLSVADLLAGCEEGFPSCYGVGSDDGAFLFVCYRLVFQYK